MTPTPATGAGAGAASSAADVLAAAARIVGSEHVAEAVRIEDASGARGVAPVVAHPGSPEEVRELVAWAYANDVEILPVGGSTGFSGGIVPVARPLWRSRSNRLNRVRSFDPLLWRIEVEAGVTTATVQRLARRTDCCSRPTPAPPKVADRWQPRDQRGRATRVQIRRHLALGDRRGGGDRAGELVNSVARSARMRPDTTSGAADRQRGNARDHHRGMAEVHAGAGADDSGGRRVRVDRSRVSRHLCGLGGRYGPCGDRVHSGQCTAVMRQRRSCREAIGVHGDLRSRDRG